MALLIDDKLVMLHVPKTGGTFVRRLLAEQGVAYRMSGETIEQCCHHDLSQLPGAWLGYPKAVFVRHPLSWIKSMWAHLTLNGWDNTGTPAPLAEHYEKTLSATVERVLSEDPGYVSRFFRRYTGGGPVDSIEWVGRQETLRKDLIALFDEHGVAVSPGSIYGRDDDNRTTGRMSDTPELSPDQVRRVCDAEREAIERWGYD